MGIFNYKHTKKDFFKNIENTNLEKIENFQEETLTEPLLVASNESILIKHTTLVNSLKTNFSAKKNKY